MGMEALNILVLVLFGPDLAHLLGEVVADRVLAVGAHVAPVEPLLNALRVETMQARQDHVLLLQLIL
jgi:hypothetical protein